MFCLIQFQDLVEPKLAKMINQLALKWLFLIMLVISLFIYSSFEIFV